MAPPLRAGRIIDRWAGFFTVVSPIVLFLVLLMGISYYLRLNPKLGAKVSAVLFPSAPQVPSSELFLKNVRFRRISLETGEIVPVIYGTVVNSSKNSVRDVEVQGLAFDDRGRLLTSSRVKASPTLAKSRIRSLTPEMIKKIQEGASSRAALPSGAEQEFALALLAGDTDDAQYFSARIYSVIQ